MILSTLAQLALALALAIPAIGAEAGPTGDATVVIVVRHAEKQSDGTPDPSLSEAGERRARVLAERLRTQALAAVYVTPYLRTQRTGQPVADAQGLELVVRDFVSRNADEDALAFRDELLREHRGEVVLVVGHSNTVPPLLEVLSGEEIEPMPETEYDRLSLVRIEADGRVELRVERY